MERIDFLDDFKPIDPIARVKQVASFILDRLYSDVPHVIESRE